MNTTECPRCKALDKFTVDARKRTGDPLHEPLVKNFIKHWNEQEKNACKDLILCLSYNVTDFFYNMYKTRACQNHDPLNWSMCLYTNMQEVTTLRERGLLKNVVWSVQPTATPKIIYDN